MSIILEIAAWAAGTILLVWTIWRLTHPRDYVNIAYLQWLMRPAGDNSPPPTKPKWKRIKLHIIKPMKSKGRTR